MITVGLPIGQDLNESRHFIEAFIKSPGGDGRASPMIQAMLLFPFKEGMQFIF